MKVLVACEESQAVTKAFRARGHNAYSCDLEPCSGGRPEWHIQEDIFSGVLRDGWDVMIAFPPCTRLSNSGVRWLHSPPKNKTWDEMWHELYEAVTFYKKIRAIGIKKIAIENPIMHKYARAMIGNLERKIVQPWWFGEKAFKATGFELHNLPELLPTNKLIPPLKGTEEHKQWSAIHRMPPSKDRAKLRSKTYPGIAKAMAEQWGSLKKLA